MLRGIFHDQAATRRKELIGKKGETVPGDGPEPTQGSEGYEQAKKLQSGHLREKSEGNLVEKKKTKAGARGDGSKGHERGGSWNFRLRNVKPKGAQEAD